MVLCEHGQSRLRLSTPTKLKASPSFMESTVAMIQRMSDHPSPRHTPLRPASAAREMSPLHPSSGHTLSAHDVQEGWSSMPIDFQGHSAHWRSPESGVLPLPPILRTAKCQAQCPREPHRDSLLLPLSQSTTNTSRSSSSICLAPCSQPTVRHPAPQLQLIIWHPSSQPGIGPHPVVGNPVSQGVLPQPQQPAILALTPQRPPNSSPHKVHSSSHSRGTHPHTCVGSTWVRIGRPMVLPLQKLMVFWDMENCPVPKGVNPALVSRNVQHALSRHPATAHCRLSGFLAFGNLGHLSERSKEACRQTGIGLVDAVSPWKNGADFVIVSSMFSFAMDNPPPCSVLLISGDRDFASCLHTLRHRGYSTNLSWRTRHSRASLGLIGAADFIWDWEFLARGVAQ